MFAGHPVIDGDSHKVENWVVLKDYLPSAYRDRIRPEQCAHGYARVVFDDFNPATGKTDLRRVFARPEGPGKGLFAAFHREGSLGGLFNRVRLEHMDREGIDLAILFPTVSMGLNCLLDVDFAVALARAYNDYLWEDVQCCPGRLLPIGLIPLIDVQAGLEELERCFARGVVGFTMAPSVPVPHPDAPGAYPTLAWPNPISAPQYRPLLERAAALGAAVCIHGAGPGMSMPGGVYDFTESFLINHIFGHRNQMQLALARVIFDAVLEDLPTLRMGFLEGGCGWVPDLIHAFHEHWEKRVRDFDPDLQLDLGAWQKELVLEKGPTRARELILAHGRIPLSQRVFLRRGEAFKRRRGEDPYTWESRLATDPVAFFQSGRLIFGFESDDPAPAYMVSALGDWGAHLPMFSVDYGHWDGEVEGCVKRVVDNPRLSDVQKRMILGENAVRFYGVRLATAVKRFQGLAEPDAWSADARSADARSADAVRADSRSADAVRADARSADALRTANLPKPDSARAERTQGA